jgi:hypothetical protein
VYNFALASKSPELSSPASRTQSDLKNLAAAVELFKSDTGHHPDPKQYWLELEQKDLRYHRDQSGPLKDRWDRPVIYRLPGKQRDFDLYSIGPDGIDSNGALDDVSLAGVNDGFHWKATWPTGRRTLRLTVGLTLASLLLAFLWPWRTIVPLAGMISCIGTIAGCRLLMHPEFVRFAEPTPSTLYLSGSVSVWRTARRISVEHLEGTIDQASPNLRSINYVVTIDERFMRLEAPNES